MHSIRRSPLDFRLALIPMALLFASSEGRAAQLGRFPRSFVVRPREAPAESAIKNSALLAKMERYCQNDKCVVLPSTDAEVEGLNALAARGMIEAEPFDDSRRIYFAKATYDVDRADFDVEFPGRSEVDAASQVRQWAVIFKAFLDPSWEKDIESAGLYLGDSLGPVAYQVYGPADALDRLRATVPYIAAIVPVPNGVKRFRVDTPLPGDEAGAPVRTTVVIFAIEDSPARALLERREGRPLPVVYTSKKTVAYGVALSRDEALYLSSFPDVVAIMRETALAVPSDERSNVIIGGAFQSPNSSWPLTLSTNTTATSWTSYLSSLANMGIQPSRQTIGFLDSGVGLSPMQSCPPSLVDPNNQDNSTNCSLMLAPDQGTDLRSITDIMEEFSDSSRRANDYLAHGTLTTAIAAGFSPLGFSASTGGRDSQKYSYLQGVAPGAKIAMSRMLQDVACLPPSTPAGLRYFRQFPRMPGGGYMYQDDNKLRYSLAVLSQPLFTSTPDGANGAGATLFNHSWNRPLDSDYGVLDIYMDKSARTLHAISFDFGSTNQANEWYGAELPATHVVSAGNTHNDSGLPNPTMVTTPGTAKNVVTIGATETFRQLEPAYPSGCRAGALADSDVTRQISVLSRYGYPNFRLKPDFVAPGNRVAGPLSTAFYTSSSCIKELSCYSTAVAGPPSYVVTSGTSFAAPVATGVVVLLREWFRVLGRGVPSPALVRAMLVVGAQNLVASRDGQGNCFDGRGGQWSCGDMRPAPDQFQGWGGISLDRYFRAPTNYYFFDQGQTLCQSCTGNGSQPWTTTLTINDPSKAVRIALVWTDAAGNAVVSTAYNLKNDLDLEVRATGSDGVPHVWYGNLFYLNRDDLSRREFSLRDPAAPVYRDRKNNQEKVAIPAVGEANGLPAGATTLTITVSAFNISESGMVPDDPTRVQDFAVAVENAH